METSSLQTLLGLSDTETQIYMAVLRGGKLSQTDIANETNTNRTSLYPLLRSLSRRDLLIKTVRGKRIYYTAANPNVLLKNARRAYQQFETALPLLVETYKKANHKPTITVRDEKQGIQKALEALFEEGAFVKSFASPSNFLNVLGAHGAQNLVKIAKRRDIKSYVLTSDTKTDRELSTRFVTKNVRWCVMPPDISYPVEFACNHKSTVITSWQRRFAVVVESEDIADFVAQLFDHFWHLGTEIRNEASRSRRRKTKFD